MLLFLMVWLLLLQLWRGRFLLYLRYFLLWVGCGHRRPSLILCVDLVNLLLMLLLMLLRVLLRVLQVLELELRRLGERGVC